jgi:hypothetical protein
VSQESTTPDVEALTRETWKYFSDGDLDGLMRVFGPESLVLGTGLGTFEAPTAIRRYFEDWRSSYEDFGAYVEEVRDLGSGVTFAVVLQRARLVGSSGYVEHHVACVMKWRGSTATRTRYFGDIDKARAAAERLAEGTA